MKVFFIEIQLAQNFQFSDLMAVVGLTVGDVENFESKLIQFKVDTPKVCKRNWFSTGKIRLELKFFQEFKSINRFVNLF